MHCSVKKIKDTVEYVISCVCFRYDEYDDRDREPPQYDRPPRYDPDSGYGDRQRASIDGEKEYQGEPSKFDAEGRPRGPTPNTSV